MRPPQQPRALRDAPTPPTAPSAAEPPAERAARLAPVVALRPQTTAVDTRRTTPSVTERVRELEAATRHALVRRVALVGAILAAVVLAGWVAFASPLFALDPARVTIAAPEGQVDVAAAQGIATARAGVPLPRLSTGALEDLLEQIPTVHTASVTRDWPRGLAITLTARQPVAAVPSEAGYLVFDGEGVQLGTLAAPPGGVPVVDVPVGDDTARTLGAALNVLSVLPYDLRAAITGVSAASDASIAFTLADGATVRWGTDSDNELKLAVLQTLRQVPARVYDVSTPRAPITE